MWAWGLDLRTGVAAPAAACEEEEACARSPIMILTDSVLPLPLCKKGVRVCGGGNGGVKDPHESAGPCAFRALPHSGLNRTHLPTDEDALVPSPVHQAPVSGGRRGVYVWGQGRGVRILRVQGGGEVAVCICVYVLRGSCVIDLNDSHDRRAHSNPT